MGFPVALFVDRPDEEWICAICHDVVEDPVGTPCGHSFCFACLDQWLVDREECPSCRNGGLSTDDEEGRNCFALRAVQKFILKSTVRCSGNSSMSETVEPASSRRRLNNGEASQTAGCNWTGKLDDYENHRHEECACHVVECSVPGCDHTCPRGDLPKHTVDNVVSHMDMIVKAKTDALEKKYKEKLEKNEFMMHVNYRQRLERRLVDCHINMFCQQWIRRKPDALFDFCIHSYREPPNCMFHHNSDPSAHRYPDLLVGIPGPLNTPWEGGLFPVVMEWTCLKKPPKCRFPKGFRHCNVYPSGTISVSTLNEEEHWTPFRSIPELLFSIQQLLAHPNPDSPAQKEAYECYVRDFNEYKEQARQQTKMYSANTDFLASARAAFGEDRIPSTMMLVSDDYDNWKEAHKRVGIAVEDEPVARPQLPEAKGGCGCSCCAWGATFWDSRRDMRFLFGIAG